MVVGRGCAQHRHEHTDTRGRGKGRGAQIESEKRKKGTWGPPTARRARTHSAVVKELVWLRNYGWRRRREMGGWHGIVAGIRTRRRRGRSE